MKNKNGIEICCQNCLNNRATLSSYFFAPCMRCGMGKKFVPDSEAYEARIAELQNSLDETEKKLTETIKLLSERSRECGKLEAEVDILKGE